MLNNYLIVIKTFKKFGIYNINMVDILSKIYYRERDNLDKRKLKIIHPFDGRGYPLDIDLWVQESKKLGDQLKRINFDYIVGFAEAGIISALGVANILKKPFVGSYRVKLKEGGEITFLEPHSTRANHYLYGLKKGDKVIIVEDEITSGDTILNAIRSLNKNGILVMGIAAFIINGKKRMYLEKLRKLNIPLFYLIDLENGTN